MTVRWCRSILAIAVTAVFALAVGITPAQAEWKGETWFTTLDVKKAWAISQGAGVTVAVVDTGVVDTLGDLQGRVLPGVDLATHGPDGRSDPGDGCELAGGCFSHGTQMALLIAGTGAGKGFQGIAPRAKILPVKVSAGTAVESDAQTDARGIRWAVDYGAQVINVSIAGASRCEPDLATAVKYAYQHDVIVVAGAGNEATAVGSPANCPGALAISGEDVHFNAWSKTNYGPTVAFTGSAADDVQESLTGHELVHGSGTSGATAIVSGTFALIRAHFPTMSARDIVTHAIWTVHNGTGKFGVRVDDKLGYGEILPYFAMTYPVKATAANPIYDAFARELGPATPQGSGSASSPGQPTGTSSAPSRPSIGGITIHPKSANSSGGSSSVLIAVIAAIVIALLIVMAVVLRSRRQRPAHTTPHPGQ